MGVYQWGAAKFAFLNEHNVFPINIWGTDYYWVNYLDVYAGEENCIDLAMAEDVLYSSAARIYTIADNGYISEFDGYIEEREIQKALDNPEYIVQLADDYGLVEQHDCAIQEPEINFIARFDEYGFQEMKNDYYGWS